MASLFDGESWNALCLSFTSSRNTLSESLLGFCGLIGLKLPSPKISFKISLTMSLSSSSSIGVSSILLKSSFISFSSRFNRDLPLPTTKSPFTTPLFFAAYCWCSATKAFKPISSDSFVIPVREENLAFPTSARFVRGSCVCRKALLQPQRLACHQS